MDLKQLEYFLRVAELGSFTQAAQLLNIAQPAISRQVRSLEVELRQNLLERNGRGVTTTEAGKLLMEHCRGILHQVDRAKEDMARVHGALAGRVALGIVPSASKMLTVPLTKKFRKRLPNANLSITEGLSYMIQESLIAGRLDIALIYNPSASIDNDMDLIPLTSESLYLVGTKGPHPINSPISLKTLSNIPLIIPNRPHTVRVLVESQMNMINCKLNNLLEIDGITAILDLVADGAGYAILTKHAIITSGHAEKYHIRKIIEPELHSRLFIATAAGRIATTTQKATLDLIRKTVKAVYPEKMIINFD